MNRSRAYQPIRGHSLAAVSFAILMLFAACLQLVLYNQVSSTDFSNRSIFENEPSSSASRVFLSDHKEISDEDEGVIDVGNNAQEHRLAGLNCDRWGGPANDIAQEMVYWEDIPSDSQFIPPFHRKDGPTQYFTFEPDFAGFNNVRMSMETLLSAAFAMGRTLVLPPAKEFLMLSGSKEQGNEFTFSDFFPMGSISREHKGFSIITMEDYLKLFLEGKFRNEKTREPMFPPNNRTDWNGCSKADFGILQKWLRQSSKRLKVNADVCLLAFPRSADPQAIEELQGIQNAIKGRPPMGYKEFLGKPRPVDASPEERLRESWAKRNGLCLYDQPLQEAPWVHFPLLREKEDPSRMLVHFYAFLFFADWKVDLLIKRFVRDHVRYVDEIQCAAARIVSAIQKRVLKRTNGRSKDFDTMHVRRGDFQNQYQFTDITVEEMYEMTTQRIPDNTTVYIATDEQNKAFYNMLKEHYDVVFFDDFKDELGDIGSSFYGMIEQLIASRGRVFFGCWPSTFTGYINRLRGYHANKQKSPGYETGIIPSFYYTPKGNFLSMQTYYPMKPVIWTREFPTSWRLIDTGVADSRNNKEQYG